MIVLGFDISSTTTAYSVYEIDNKTITLKSTNYIKPIKTRQHYI